MHRYTAKSGSEYVIYQGVDDTRKHPESANLWFYAPTTLFRSDVAFNTAFHSSSEAQQHCEEHSDQTADLEKFILSRLSVLNRRAALRVVRNSE